jgi:7-keto-8-aminopelargonate synthetase-like enzyme/acyl carrier protein
MEQNALRRHLLELVRFAIVNVSGRRLTPTDNDEVNLFDSGMDSLTAFRLSKLLSSTLKIILPVTLIFEYPTTSALVEYLANIIVELPEVDFQLLDPAPALPGRFELVDFIETRNNPLLGQLTEFHLNVTQQQHRLLDIDGKKYIDFASCNYLGFDYHPDIMAAIPKMVEKWGVHPSWTRLVASPAPYRELEEQLAQFLKAPATLVFPCIAMLNFGALPILAGANGVILCDSAAHHTVQEACQLAAAKGVTCAHFRSNDLDDLERQLQRYSSKSPKIVAVDGVYSMTANYVDLPGYSRKVKKYDDAFLFVDDAHGFGIIGENPTDTNPYGHKGNGIVNYFGMDYVEDRVIYIAGMSKAFSSFAAFIVCLNREMEQKLRLSSTYVFSGPIPVASLASSLAGLTVNEKEGDQIRVRLYQLSERLASGARSLGFAVDNYGSFPIVYVVTGAPEATVRALNIAWERGLLVSPGIFPAVSIHHGGLRFSVTAINTEAEIDTALSILEEIRKTL